MVRLKPVVDLVGHLVLHVLASHARLIDEKFLDETLCEAGSDMLVRLLRRRGVLAEVNLGAPCRNCTIARCLVSVSAVETEHELVSNLVQEWNIGTELDIIDLKRFGELYLHKLIELFSALSSVRSAVKQSQ